MKTDARLRDDIIAELDWDPRFDARDIGVAVKNADLKINDGAFKRHE